MRAPKPSLDNCIHSVARLPCSRSHATNNLVTTTSALVRTCPGVHRTLLVPMFWRPTALRASGLATARLARKQSASRSLASSYLSCVRDRLDRVVACFCAPRAGCESFVVLAPATIGVSNIVSRHHPRLASVFACLRASPPTDSPHRHAHHAIA